MRIICLILHYVLNSANETIKRNDKQNKTGILSGIMCATNISSSHYESEQYLSLISL